MILNRNPKNISLLALVVEDLRTHGWDPISQGFWAIFVHRIGNASSSIRIPFFSVLIKFIFRFSTRLIEWLCGITLLHTTSIGRCVRIWHHSGIVINADSIGDGVVIRQNTTIGEVAGKSGRPTVGDRVDIGCGAVILGPVVIGNDAIIGANAVVVSDVPEGAVAAGVPAKIIRTKV